jgi:small conductance mechanosensitive channel
VKSFRSRRWQRALVAFGLWACSLAGPAHAQAEKAEATPEVEAGEEAEAPAEAEAPRENLLVEEARELETRLGELRDARGDFEARLKRAKGEELLILEEQNWRRQLAFHQTARLLTHNTLRQERDELDVAEQQERLVSLWQEALPAYVDLIQWRTKKLASLRRERESAPQEAHLDLDARITEQGSRLQNTLRVSIEAFELAESVGIEVENYRDEVRTRLGERAERIAGRVRLISRERKDLRKRSEKAPGDSTLAAQSADVESSFQEVTDHLAEAIALMAKLDLPTAEYQQLLIESTGEITAGLLDKEVLLGLFDSWRRQLMIDVSNRGAAWIAKTFVFAVLLLFFRLLAGLTRRVVAHSLSSGRVNVSVLLEKTLVSWSSRMVMAIGLLVAFSQLGIQIAPLLAGLGIAGFVIGFALQDSLSNFASGAMILVYRPFDVGDVIEAATVSGQVRAMSLVSTTILTFDNQTLIVPNTKIWGDVIRNVTAQKTRRVDLIFSVAYDTDIDHAEGVIRSVLSENDKILDEPTPIVEVHKLGDSSVDFAVRPWVQTVDYWKVFWSLNRAMKQRFDAEGIQIPFPQRDVHHYPAARPDGSSG